MSAPNKKKQQQAPKTAPYKNEFETIIEKEFIQRINTLDRKVGPGGKLYYDVLTSHRNQIIDACEEDIAEMNNRISNIVDFMKSININSSIVNADECEFHDWYSVVFITKIIEGFIQSMNDKDSTLGLTSDNFYANSIQCTSHNFSSHIIKTMNDENTKANKKLYYGIQTCYCHSFELKKIGSLRINFESKISFLQDQKKAEEYFFIVS